MKIKKLLLSVLAIIPAFLMIGNVSAGSNDSNITYQKIDGAYFYLKNKNTGTVDTNYVTKFFLNGKIAYCIDPMIDITTSVYSSGGWSATNLSAETKEYIEMVGYFGYEYPSHRTDKYWLAAQKLIWEKANSNVSVRITNGANGTGGDYDLSRETNEILSLINNYKKLPSIANTTISGNIDNELVVTDTNKTLENYTMSYSGKHNVTKSGNSLKIKLARNEITNETIKFTRVNYDNEPTIIYYQGSSQKLASLRISNKSEFTVNLQSKGATIEINKIGEQLVYENASYRYDLAKVPNTKFALYSNEDILDSKGKVIYKAYQLIDTFTTNSESIATLNDMYLGKYFWVEVESANNHILDNEKYYFEITKDDIVNGKIIKHFDFNNYLPKGTLEFTKTDLVTGKPIAGTTIQIFTENDRLIFTGTTSNDGTITITDLPVGEKLYIIEKNATNGYKLTDEVIYFQITEDNGVIKANMTNEKIEEPKEDTPQEPEKKTVKEIVKVPNTGLDSTSMLVLAYWSTFFLFGIVVGYLFREYRFQTKDKDKKNNEKNQR